MTTKASKKHLRVILSAEFEQEEHARVTEMAKVMGTSVSNMMRRLLRSEHKRQGDNYDPRLFQDQANPGTPGKLPSWNRLATILKREPSVTEAVRTIARKYKCSENRVWIRLRKEQNENGNDYKSIVGINLPSD